MYSEKAIELVIEYFKLLPRLFQLIEQGRSLIFESDLFPNAIGQNKITEVIKWIKQQSHASCEKRSCGVDAVEKEVLPVIVNALKKIKVMVIYILEDKPSLLIINSIKSLFSM